MDLSDLVEYSRIKAIQAAIEPTLDSIYRMKCREYSDRFKTPLHIVINELDPLFIFQHLYEDQFSYSVVDEDLEGLLDILHKIKDPEYSRMSKQETEDLVDAVMNREWKRHEQKKKTQQKEEPTKVDPRIKTFSSPKSGGMDFKKLEELEAKAETNKAGFED